MKYNWHQHGAKRTGCVATQFHMTSALPAQSSNLLETSRPAAQRTQQHSEGSKMKCIQTLKYSQSIDIISKHIKHNNILSHTQSWTQSHLQLQSLQAKRSCTKAPPTQSPMSAFGSQQWRGKCSSTSAPARCDSSAKNTLQICASFIPQNMLPPDCPHTRVTRSQLQFEHQGGTMTQFAAKGTILSPDTHGNKHRSTAIWTVAVLSQAGIEQMC